MIVAVPREVRPGENRVALVPSGVAKLIASGAQVRVETQAGAGASYSDAAYEKAGARVEDSPERLYDGADLILKVQAPGHHADLGRQEVELLPIGSTLVSFLFPASCPETIGALQDRRISSLAMELMPRITRAQSMDALSSMSSIAGYKAVLVAADLLPKLFPMMMTAAGTITAAKVLVLGAGVAGLQAIATARRLGAVVEAFDIRPVVKEQVESLGARFVDIQAFANADAQDKGGYAKAQSEEQQEAIRRALLEHVAKSDAVITTALVPGRRAPVLVTTEMVKRMSAGSVIIDLAAEQGGNCELTVAGRTIVHEGVTIAGPENLPSTVPVHASDMYSRNISTFILQLLKEGELELDLNDELVSATLVTHDGRIVHEGSRAALETPSEKPNDQSTGDEPSALQNEQ